MQRLLIVLMLAAAGGFTQGRSPQKSVPAASPKWPIEGINLEGIHHYTREQVLAASGLRIGEVAGRPEFEAARDRLIATGAFETVGYKFIPAEGGKGYVATFQLTEI